MDNHKLLVVYVMMMVHVIQLSVQATNHAKVFHQMILLLCPCAVEESVVMEPVQNDPIMQPVENELDEEDEDIMFRADDSQGFLNPVSEEDTLNSPEEDERGQEEANGETEEQRHDREHEKFEQELNGTPGSSGGRNRV